MKCVEGEHGLVRLQRFHHLLELLVLMPVFSSQFYTSQALSFPTSSIISLTFLHFYPFAENLSRPEESPNPIIRYKDSDSVSLTIAHLKVASTVSPTTKR
uniref:Uncharacterized protein n=1 Tax=Nelumbo nucifera TaxID=4432 RepID=A0A822Z4Z3_NELNU|nr:TPA_asm: hypothetical protein HUJ06_008717 [Nelumbo nucifera]